MANPELRVLISKRTSLKAQITLLEKHVDEGVLDSTNLKLRIEKLTVLFDQYEQNVLPQLITLSPEIDHFTQFDEIQNNFYALKTRITNTTRIDQPIICSTPAVSSLRSGTIRQETPPVSFNLPQSGPSNESQNNSSSILQNSALNASETLKRIKLPVATLPSFEGSFDGWLAFKNTFLSLINARDDLSNVEKFLYLRSCLRGDAAKKIALLCPSDHSYDIAWQLLTDTYEIKRLLISRHLLGILNLPNQKNETSEGLSYLVETVQQHVKSLESLNVNIESEIRKVGPTIQPKLFEQLIKARCHKILITADIEKMYRQIWIHESDRKYQRIFWRINNEIQTYQLNTVTFGVASSPFLAIRVLKQLADDDGYKFPLAANILRSDFYVDDLITGANNLSVAIQIQQELSQLLKNGGFKIRQWASNDPRVLVHCESDSINSNLLFDRDNILKTLGIYWNATSDSISYTVKPIAHTERITKRFILSEIAKIFDPLGLLGPVILFAKIIMQQCWKCKVSWDETVPTNLHTTWSHFANQLNSLNNISVNRRLVVDDSVSIQIHGFCDASQFGYGACIYIRSIDNKGHIQSHLLCGKSRVIPVKGMTIPRAELSGALVLARLVNDIRTTLILQIDQIFLWCDSTITLHWINTSPNLLKIFVSNRVREIRELTTNCIWRHINTKNNPADALSRGQLPDAFLQNQMWFNGPSWLQQPESKWPNVTLQIPLEISEIRNNICLATTITNHTEFLNRFSSFRRAVRVISYCLRMKLNSQFKRTITIDEIHATEIQILRLVQAEAFHEEINVILTLNKMKKNRLTSLAPFLDRSGILRVGGRLIHSSLSHSQKHPILLPKNHHVTNIIISDAHLDNHHSGIQSTLHFIRHKYWLLDGKNQVRYVIHKCIPCFRFRAQPVSYKMGDLPEFRVNQARPFKNTGIDYCGPLFIKERKFRNRGRIKVYICVFICMTTRAIHLEVVSDMTTVGFLGALSRFIGRRGIPTNVYSDNGTNFIGANNELKQLYVLFNSESFHNEVNHFALRKHISWHFIPPLTPHFGGMWEAGVKSFKHHFKRVIGDRLTTFEELNTLVIEIESILNSRPLCAISSDPNDPTALTPAHWFIGEPFTALPEHDLLSVPENRLSSWQIIKKGRQEFWRRWSEEYLGELQKRYKWTESKGELQLGILVLIKDKNLPPLQWQLGRVIDLHPGLDGVVRVATVKTSNSKLKRSTTLLCPLPGQNVSFRNHQID
ncbi:uncharacterized protein [Prorops nasuta]|uniref:uncharacterized protein n=1 Tax=Prorops nasuta TaxID=863751 RepID=UPI0034CED6E1